MQAQTMNQVQSTISRLADLQTLRETGLTMISQSGGLPEGAATRERWIAQLLVSNGPALRKLQANVIDAAIVNLRDAIGDDPRSLATAEDPVLALAGIIAGSRTRHARALDKIRECGFVPSSDPATLDMELEMAGKLFSAEIDEGMAEVCNAAITRARHVLGKPACLEAAIIAEDLESRMEPSFG